MSGHGVVVQRASVKLKPCFEGSQQPEKQRELQLIVPSRNNHMCVVTRGIIDRRELENHRHIHFSKVRTNRTHRILLIKSLTKIEKENRKENRKRKKDVQ